MRKSIKEAILREVTAAQAFTDTAEKESRELSDVEKDTITAHLAKGAALRKSGETEDAMRDQMRALGDGLSVGASDDAMGVGIVEPGTPAAKTARRVSIGEKFVKSAEWQSMLKSNGGTFSEKLRVQSSAVSYKDLLTGADHDDSAGALLRPDYRGMLDPFYQRPLTLRDVVAPGQTSTDTIEYVRLISVTNNAATVPEATTSAAVDGTTVTDVLGGVKPESGMTFEKDSTTVKTIAHWIPATKRALADASQVRTLIDSFLRYGLEEELEDQILDGNGVGENFLGLAHTSGVQTQAPVSGKDVFDLTRMARRKVRIGGRAIPTAYVMNPIDWEAVELKRDERGVFYAGGPFNMSTPRLWGLPVIESEVVPAGTAYVADWKQAVLYDREQAGIQVTDAHADFFIRNLVAILAEMRAAFCVLRPSAFVKITLA